MSMVDNIVNRIIASRVAKRVLANLRGTMTEEEARTYVEEHPDTEYTVEDLKVQGNEHVGQHEAPGRHYSEAMDGIGEWAVSSGLTFEKNGLLKMPENPAKASLAGMFNSELGFNRAIDNAERMKVGGAPRNVIVKYTDDASKARIEENKAKDLFTHSKGAMPNIRKQMAAELAAIQNAFARACVVRPEKAVSSNMLAQAREQFQSYVGKWGKAVAG